MEENHGKSFVLLIREYIYQHVHVHGWSEAAAIVYSDPEDDFGRMGTTSLDGVALVYQCSQSFEKQ